MFRFWRKPVERTQEQIIKGLTSELELVHREMTKLLEKHGMSPKRHKSLSQLIEYMDQHLDEHFMF